MNYYDFKPIEKHSEIAKNILAKWEKKAQSAREETQKHIDSIDGKLQKASGLPEDVIKGLLDLKETMLLCAGQHPGTALELNWAQINKYLADAKIKSFNQDEINKLKSAIVGSKDWIKMMLNLNNTARNTILP